MASFSIVIPFYNNSNQVKLCIKSIIKYFKIKKTKFEIILVDDASKKIHNKEIKNFISNFSNYKFTIIRNFKNYGPATSRNIGSSSAKFDYIFFLDSDTILHKNILKIILNNLKKSNIIIGHYHFVPANNTISANFKAIFNYFHFSQKKVTKYETFNSACAVIKKKIFFELKGFNRNIKWGMDYENEEFGRRISKKYNMILDPLFTVKHEFPNLFKMLKLYFTRAIPYIGVILHDKKLENSGPGNSTTLYSMFFSIFTSINLQLFFFSKEILYLILFVIFLNFFFISNMRFFLFSIKIKQSQIIFFILIKYILDHILFFASIVGILKFMIKKIIEKF